MLLKTLATLGRVSNLPTVWSNILAATLFAQSTSHTTLTITNLQILLTVSALSLMYISGMFLNDAFDYNWDIKNNNRRPIVNGKISLKSVWIIGSLLLAAGVLLIVIQQNMLAAIAAIVLSSAIVLYNALHKKHPMVAFIMGFTRFCVYIISALLLSSISTELLIIAFALLLYITGITLVARSEQANTLKYNGALLLLLSPLVFTLSYGFETPLYWIVSIIYITWVGYQIKTKILTQTPNISAGIGGLLAAIPLIDALALASIGALIPTIICLVIFLLIPYLHKFISGT